MYWTTEQKAMYLHLFFLYLLKFRHRVCTLSRKVKPAKSQCEEGMCTFMYLTRTVHLSILFPLKIREINSFVHLSRCRIQKPRGNFQEFNPWTSFALGHGFLRVRVHKHCWGLGSSVCNTVRGNERSKGEWLRKRPSLWEDWQGEGGFETVFLWTCLR